MYTPGEVTKMLGIPSSTLRRYVSEFGDFLSDNATKRRGRTFTEGDIEVIATIRGLTQDGVRIDDVGPKLSEVVSVPSESTDSPPESAIALISNQLESVRAVIANMQSENEQQAERVDDLEQRLQWLSTPWWKRIRTKPPETQTLIRS